MAQTGDGQIAAAELYHVVRSWGHDASQEEISNMINYFGLDSMIRNDFENVFSVFRDMREVSEEQLRGTFEILDRDGDGFLSREELRDTMMMLGDEASDEDLDKMLEEADKDGDGKVSYKEFVEMIMANV
jgi:calmodulin